MRCIAPLKLRTGETVPCGKCNCCRLTRRVDWSFRLAQELKVAETAKFVTFTYSDKHLHFDAQGRAILDRRDVQLFLKKLRKASGKARVRYYIVGEYGENFSRPHYHALLFNVPLQVYGKLLEIWKLGSIHVQDINGARIYYTCKYHVNGLEASDGRAPPFALMSRKPGIGFNYLSTHSEWHKKGKRNYTNVNGRVSRLPRYYKEKLFSKPLRYKMALEAQRLGFELYWKEIERLAKFDPDPFERYEMGLRWLCDSISEKSPYNNSVF